MSTDLFLRDGARFQVVPNDELRALWIRDEHGFIEATMHFGMSGGRPSFSLAVDQLEALVAELVELHAQLGDKVGRPHLRVTVAEPPTGPDEPTDEPTDEPVMQPAEICGVAGGFDGEPYRCTRELGHDGQHEDWSTESPITYQWHDWSVPVAVLPGVE